MPEPARQIECLAFDLDDTLYPERECVVPRLTAVAEFLTSRLGPRLDFREALVRAYEERRPGGLFATVLARAGIGPERGLVDELVALYRGGPVSITAYADVHPFLARWQHRVALALVTDGYPPTQRKKVESLGIQCYFRIIVYTGDLGQGKAKPSAEPFRLVAERLRVGGAAAYVGDNPVLDVAGPRSLGWLAVRIRRAGTRFRSQKAPRGSLPDFEISGLDELESTPGLARLLNR